jgi:hypothetical protein
MRGAGLAWLEFIINNIGASQSHFGLPQIDADLKKVESVARNASPVVLCGPSGETEPLAAFWLKPVIALVRLQEQ